MHFHARVSANNVHYLFYPRIVGELKDIVLVDNCTYTISIHAIKSLLKYSLYAPFIRVNALLNAPHLVPYIYIYIITKNRCFLKLFTTNVIIITYAS